MNILSIPDNSQIKIYLSNGKKKKGVLLAWEEDFLLIRDERGHEWIINRPNVNIVMLKVINGGTITQEQIEQPYLPQEESVENIEARSKPDLVKTHINRAVENWQVQNTQHKQEWVEAATNPIPSPLEFPGAKYERPTFQK